MFTVTSPEGKSNKNEARMHFTWSLAVLGTFKLPIKGLSDIYYRHETQISYEGTSSVISKFLSNS